MPATIKDLETYNKIVDYILKAEINSIKFLNIRQMERFLKVSHWKANTYAKFYFNERKQK